jgi:hypothetical protein
MTYPVNGSIPGPNDLLSQSQGQIQTNFSNIVGWSAVDHVEYGSANAGTHEQVTFSNVTSQSTPSDPESILYTKNDASSHPQLFFLNSQNSSQYVIGSSNNSGGCVPLFGGIILQWKYVSTTPGGSPFTFPITFPNYVFSVTIGGVAAGAQSFALSGISTSGGTIYNQVGGGNQNAYIIAIGK